MRITFFLVFCMFFYASANSYSQNTRLNLTAKNSTIVELIQNIEAQSKFVFLYQAEDLNLDKKIDVDFKNATIQEILDVALEGESISYEIFDRQILLSKDEKSLPGVQQQKHDVSGIVIDKSGLPLPGVTALIKGTTMGAITDNDGKYVLSDLTDDAVLVFSFVGMKTKEIAVGNKTVINVTLDEETIGLDEVVAVGYGTQSRRTLTSAISKVKGNILEDVPITTVGDGLKGKIAGVRVTTTNSQPGSNVEIRIRGGSSINNSNDPLILIDGVERSMEELNPNDIESIEVLKDAASTAIYGARASNGVVLVTTKKGTKGAPGVTFETSVAVQGPTRKYDFLNAREYLTLLRPAIANSKTTSYLTKVGSAGTGNDESSLYSVRVLADGETVSTGWQTMVDPVDETQTLIFQDNSFQDEVYKTTLWQNYYLGVSGGGDKAKYAASLGYTDDDGVAIGTGFSRVNFKLNTDITVSKKLEVGMGINYAEMTTDEYDNQRNVISRGLSCPPTQRLYDDDGTPTRGYNSTSPSPLFYAYYNDQNKKTKKMTLISNLKYKIAKGFTLNAQGAIYRRNYNANSFQNANYYSSARTASFASNLFDRNKFEAYLSYRRNIDNHSFSVIGGYSYMDQKSTRYSGEAEGGNSDKITTLNGAPTKTDASSVIEKQALIGFFSRATYDYKKKYLLTLTFRTDGSSLFSEGNRWGYFPGMSVGWIVSEEEWMKSIRDISLLKLRLSYGQTGNNNIGLYDALGKYSVNYKYNGNGAIITSTMPNANLTWETTNQLDFGVDLGLFENRISLSADYFDKRTQNLLFDKTLPNTTGFSTVETNVGKVKFYGFDLELNSTNVKTKDFNWKTNFVWSFVRNKVLELPDNGRERNRIGGYSIDKYEKAEDGTVTQVGTEEFGGIAEGESLYSFYGYRNAGILKDQEAVDNALYDQNASGWRLSDKKTKKGRKELGDYEWVDRNGDDKITSEDMFKLGSTEPTSTGSLTNTFKYKNFGLNISLDWALGHSVYEQSYSRYFLATFGCNYALVEGAKNTWSESNPNAKYARFVANDPNYSANFSRTSDVFTYKADYLCIREVSLLYTLKTPMLSRGGVKSITFSVSGNNLYFFTALPGALSPEKGASTTYSSSYYCYPPVRKISFGAKFYF